MECKQCPTFILDLDNFPCYIRKWSLEKLLKVTKLPYWKWLMICSIECLFVIVVPFYEFSFVQTQTFSRIIEQFYHEGIFHNKTIFYFSSFSSSFSLLFFTPTLSLSLRYSFAFQEIRRKNNKLLLWIFFWMEKFSNQWKFSFFGRFLSYKFSYGFHIYLMHYEIVC